VIERKLQSVEGQAVEPEALSEEPVVLAFAVADVADQRMAEVLEMAADLVEAAGPRADLDQGVALEGRKAAVFGDGGDPRSSQRARDGMVDHPCLRRNAAHQGEIALLHLAGLQLRLELSGCAGIEGEEQRAARRPVEAMHRVDAPAHQIADALQRHDSVLRRSPVHGQARRLVDGEKKAVAMEDGEVEGRGHGLPLLSQGS